jgi:SAM-dependent methyltransferase
MTGPKADVWKSASLSAKYLKGIRGAIPLAGEQIDILVRLIAAVRGDAVRGDAVNTFLDLGCGGGILGAAILRRWPQARGVFLDFSDAMLQAAREELSPYGEQLTFVDADYGDPAWLSSVSQGETFDVVVSGFSIHHQSDERKQQLYDEIFDLLPPGGLFLNLEHVSSPARWIETAFEDYFVDALHDMHRREGSGRSREKVADEFYRRPDKEANILAPLETQCDWLRTIGFEDVDCYFKAFELALFGGRRPAG